MNERPHLATEHYKPKPGNGSRIWEQGAPPIGARIDPAALARFKLVDWNDIKFDPSEEWRVEDVVPLRGFGLIYGKPRSFKSFIAIHLALHVVLGLQWAGKRVEKDKVVYIAAEGAAGINKRDGL
jgi:hypothetical protein